jgi:G:T-mismatch repair DNA endonuclease (very short patch repair protein)
MSVEKSLGKRIGDKLVTRTLRQSGWRVIRIWECALQKKPQSCLQRILRATGQGA